MAKPMLLLLRVIFSLVMLATVTSCADAKGCPGNDPASIARAIANGHAYRKHVVDGGEFNKGRKISGLAFPLASIQSKSEFAALIEGIVAVPDRNKQLENRRHGYWDADTGTVVIHNARAADCGTAFRPNRGVRYYQNLN